MMRNSCQGFSANGETSPRESLAKLSLKCNPSVRKLFLPPTADAAKDDKWRKEEEEEEDEGDVVVLPARLRSGRAIRAKEAANNFPEIGTNFEKNAGNVFCCSRGRAETGFLPSVCSFPFTAGFL